MFNKFKSLLLLLIFSSCIVSKGKDDTANRTAEKNNEQEKLIFVNFKIQKDSAQINSNISLTNTKITNGSLKKVRLEDPYKPYFDNKLRCVFVNNNKPIFETIIEHPLFKKFEYANDDNTMGIKEVVLKETTFSIRTTYNKEMKYVLIFETLKDQKEKEIAKLEIK